MFVHHAALGPGINTASTALQIENTRLRDEIDRLKHHMSVDGEAGSTVTIDNANMAYELSQVWHLDDDAHMILVLPVTCLVGQVLTTNSMPAQILPVPRHCCMHKVMTMFI